LTVVSWWTYPPEEVVEPSAVLGAALGAADAEAAAVGEAAGLEDAAADGAAVGAAVAVAPLSVQTPGYDGRPGTFELVPGMPQPAAEEPEPYCS
jgi:hypothetical protein